MASSRHFVIEDDDDWDDEMEGRDKVLGYLNFRPTSAAQSVQRMPKTIH